MLKTTLGSLAAAGALASVSTHGAPPGLRHNDRRRGDRLWLIAPCRWRPTNVLVDKDGARACGGTIGGTEELLSGHGPPANGGTPQHRETRQGDRQR